MRWSVAMRQAVGYNEPRRPWSTRTHLFRVHPQASSSGEGSKRLNPVDWVALRPFGVDLRLSLAAESDSTLYGPLATYRRLVGHLKKHHGSTMTCRCFISARLQETAPVLSLISENATRWSLKLEKQHLGTYQRCSTWPCKKGCWPTLNLMHACNWVKHDRKSNKNSEAVSGNLWKVNVSVSWLFGSFFFVSNSRQFAVHYVYKFVTSLIRSDRIVEYSFVR